MTDVFQTVVVPVASTDDAEATARALAPRITDDGRAIVVHVVEKAGGAPDKASVEQREEAAEEMFAAAGRVFDDAGVDHESRVLYGTDVVDAILDAATDEDASAVVFTPRGGSRWARLLTGDVGRRLVEDANRPVVVLPAPDDVDGDTDSAETDGGTDEVTADG